MKGVVKNIHPEFLDICLKIDNGHRSWFIIDKGEETILQGKLIDIRYSYIFIRFNPELLILEDITLEEMRNNILETPIDKPVVMSCYNIYTRNDYYCYLYYGTYRELFLSPELKDKRFDFYKLFNGIEVKEKYYV
jgi:hypothetical protein